ncbi:MAG: type I restriction endonuclease subunit R [Candidatus Cloacimonetes bacterium]|nr:type I restriction endonuclease subunit R [Candidatus Cloacimonadota bacterium]
MSSTDITEKGLETIIVESLINDAGYVKGNPVDYDREHAVDTVQLMNFLNATQADMVAMLGIEEDGPRRLKFLHRLQGEIAKSGTVSVLRKGLTHGPATLELFYGKPSKANKKAVELFENNIFSVTRQLRYSPDERALALDMGIFLNGLPIMTFELKNKLTKQTVQDAMHQYKRDRDPKELLFKFGRCLVHFALDDHEVWMCTDLKGNDSWFLPFNKGFNDGAGNPPNPDGIATDYLWKQILTKPMLTDIIENYAQITEKKDQRTKKSKKDQIFPRYHQLDVVRKLLADAGSTDVGKRYLIQHSAGSGKSNSIAWLAHQLIGLRRENRDMFDSIIVVTDRRILDKQIRDTIKQFAQVSTVVGHADSARELRQMLIAGKKIIITTIQKFPFILDEIGNEHRHNKFAIVIDEAHSSQGGRINAKMNIALSETGRDSEEEETTEDKIIQIMDSRKMLTNASYFAFTATPKNKTLEMFGFPMPEGDKVKHLPFHSYTMKQAIQEGFILDVLKYYTPIKSYYKLAKKIEGDPQYDTKKAMQKMKKYVETNEHAIRQKAEIMVDHFHEQVIGGRKIGGKARAMIITNGIKLAIEYYNAVSAYLVERKSPYKAIIAFSGEQVIAGAKMTEASFNLFSSDAIKDKFQEDPYRFLIVADKFQTGYDEPLLHTMYVDKFLSGIKAVQTLSRLNRAHPQKHDTFILDFINDVDIIRDSFKDYYRTTILSDETDPDKLHDLKTALDGYQIYSPDDIENLVSLFLDDASRETLDPILDNCVISYMHELDEDGQVDFKGKAKAFNRVYSYLSALLPYNNAQWEKLSIFLTFLIPKLPAPIEDDPTKGLLETIDMDSYRLEKLSQQQISLADEDGEIDPIPGIGGGKSREPEFDYLSNILKQFNELFGNAGWSDKDKIRKIITEEIPEKLRENKTYQNAMKNSDEQNVRIELKKALKDIFLDYVTDHTKLYALFSDDSSFQNWLHETMFNVTYKKPKVSEIRD